jgi:hypothetical protein
MYQSVQSTDWDKLLDYLSLFLPLIGTFPVLTLPARYSNNISSLLQLKCVGIHRNDPSGTSLLGLVFLHFSLSQSHKAENDSSMFAFLLIN